MVLPKFETLVQELVQVFPEDQQADVKALLAPAANCNCSFYTAPELVYERQLTKLADILTDNFLPPHPNAEILSNIYAKHTATYNNYMNRN